MVIGIGAISTYEDIQPQETPIERCRDSVSESDDTELEPLRNLPYSGSDIVEEEGPEVFTGRGICHGEYLHLDTGAGDSECAPSLCYLFPRTRKPRRALRKPSVAAESSQRNAQTMTLNGSQTGFQRPQAGSTHTSRRGDYNC